MSLGKKAKYLLESRLAPFVQTQEWDDKEANEWIPKYGCLLCCLIATFVMMGQRPFYKTVDGYYHMFKDNGILKDGLIQWNELIKFYNLTFDIKPHLWSGKHHGLDIIKADLVGDMSVISVDYKANPEYKNSHWVLVLFKSKGLVTFDPWTGEVDYFPEKYTINSVEQSIFSIVNIGILL